MSDNEIRIAIAEKCGWKCCEPVPRVKDNIYARWFKGDNIREFRNLPDYPNDLNAMHEAEKVLQGDEVALYHIHIHSITDHAPKMPYELNGWVWHATARQRAEAFLKVFGL